MSRRGRRVKMDEMAFSDTTNSLWRELEMEFLTMEAKNEIYSEEAENSAHFVYRSTRRASRTRGESTDSTRLLSFVNHDHCTHSHEAMF